MYGPSRVLAILGNITITEMVVAGKGGGGGGEGGGGVLHRFQRLSAKLKHILLQAGNPHSLFTMALVCLAYLQ